MITETMRASIRVHSDGDAVGEFVSLHPTAGDAVDSIRELRDAFGGQLESPYVLHVAHTHRTYRVWCV